MAACRHWPRRQARRHLCDVMAMIPCMTGRQTTQISVRLDSTQELIPTRRKLANYSAERESFPCSLLSLYIRCCSLAAQVIHLCRCSLVSYSARANRKQHAVDNHFVKLFGAFRVGFFVRSDLKSWTARYGVYNVCICFGMHIVN